LGMFWVQEFSRNQDGSVRINLRLDEQGNENVLEMSEEEYAAYAADTGFDFEQAFANGTGFINNTLSIRELGIEGMDLDDLNDRASFDVWVDQERARMRQALSNEFVSREMIEAIIEATPGLASKGSGRGMGTPGVNLAAAELAMQQRILAERDPVRRELLQRDLANFRQANSLRPPNTSGGPNAEFRAVLPPLVTTPKHNPNSTSPQPPNVTVLYARSIPDSSGVRWSIDQNGVIHRFSRPSNGQSHWNGSTAGQGPIQQRNIPNEILRQLTPGG